MKDKIRKLRTVTMVEMTVIYGDIITRPCDLLILKHADDFYGIDAKVSQLINFVSGVADGHHVFAGGQGIGARKVLYLGVGSLLGFRYERIRAFSSRALNIAASRNGSIQTICSPVHGAGYGLDDKEAFLSLISGFYDAIANGRVPSNLKKIEIIENNRLRAQRFQGLLSELLYPSSPEESGEDGPPKEVSITVSADSRTADSRLSSFGSGSEQKLKLFVAMPFEEKFSDVWDIAIQEGCAAAGILCERVKEQAYVGDILGEIRKRVETSNGMLALLDGANPNVFLELGYAWALNKPTILIARAGAKLPFDVQGQRCLIYKSIADLRMQVTRELNQLKQLGVFGPF